VGWGPHSSSLTPDITPSQPVRMSGSPSSSPTPGIVSHRPAPLGPPLGPPVSSAPVHLPASCLTFRHHVVSSSRRHLCEVQAASPSWLAHSASSAWSSHRHQLDLLSPAQHQSSSSRLLDLCSTPVCISQPFHLHLLTASAPSSHPSSCQLRFNLIPSIHASLQFLQFPWRRSLADLCLSSLSILAVPASCHALMPHHFASPTRSPSLPISACSLRRLLSYSSTLLVPSSPLLSFPCSLCLWLRPSSLSGRHQPPLSPISFMSSSNHLLPALRLLFPVFTVATRTCPIFNVPASFYKYASCQDVPVPARSSVTGIHPCLPVSHSLSVLSHTHQLGLCTCVIA